MRYRELNIQTQREAPNNARTPGFGWLVRAGFMSREGQWLPLGELSLDRLLRLSKPITLLQESGVPLLGRRGEFLAIPSGQLRVIHCPTCGYAAKGEVAKFRKSPFSTDEPLAMETVHTPDCHTIEALSDYLKIPREKTAKALMFTRTSDGRFVFVVVRGDMSLSEVKLRNLIGDYRLATEEEILSAGATPGFASPVGLKDAMIVVDELIPVSPNLVAGANQDGYHSLNTNCGRDYVPEYTADLALANSGDPCIECGKPLIEIPAISMIEDSAPHPGNMLLALAETHHDERGLTLPEFASPFGVHLMHLSSKKLDTRSEAEKIHAILIQQGISVLFDDRDERAGVKFNDADLIGCPIRLTVGEKHIREGMVELKPRRQEEIRLVSVKNITEELKPQN